MTPLIGFAPDADPTSPGVITDGQAFVPSEYGIKGAPSLVSVGMPALAAEVRGAALVTLVAGTTKLFAGTTEKLYEQTSATAWTDRSRGGNYTLGTNDRWHIAQYGDATLAACGAAVLQRASGGAFANVSGAPTGKIVVTASGFAMVLNTATNSDEWYCSAYLDETDWTLNVSTQCVSGRLVQGPGEIRTAMRLGDDIIAYKRDSMYQGRYQGAPAVWGWTQISADTGCVGLDAVVSTPQGHVFLGLDNLYLFDGSAPKPLATGTIRRWLAREVSAQYANRAKLQFDRDNHLVYVHFPGNGDTACTRCVVYHMLSGRWGIADMTIEAVVKWLSAGVIYDVGSPIVTDFDTGPEISFDAGIWTADREIPSVFDSAHTLKAKAGSCSTAYIVTGDYGDESAFSYVDELRVRYSQEPLTSTVIGLVKDHAGRLVASAQSSTLAEGKYALRQNGRWHRFRLETTGDFHLTAIRPRVKVSGAR